MGRDNACAIASKDSLMVQCICKLCVSLLCLLQANNNGQIGIAQNHCSGNTISGNSVSSNAFEGITADNLSDRSQVSWQLQNNA